MRRAVRGAVALGLWLAGALGAGWALGRQEDGPLVRPSDVGLPINRRFEGLSMFRGNATRTYYGKGPVPQRPEVLWSYPRTAMCAHSRVGRQNPVWCGSGWTGQPSVVVRDTFVEVIFGAYDRRIHFLDGRTGRQTRPSFATGDIIKGSVTVDPDGYPLLYSGSRDNYFRVIALDRARPTELWRLSAADAPDPRWNDDWDGNAVVIEDYLFEGGENGWFYIVKLNRHYDSDRQVQVRPEVLLRFPGFDRELLDSLRDQNVSIESSVALIGSRVYFVNSGGLVWGLELGGLRRDPSSVRPAFRYWGGDDTNATIVADEEGAIYVAVEEDRRTLRSRSVGLLYKLDPRRADPRVWGLPVARAGDGRGGIYSTPALFGRMLFVTTHAGALLGVDRDSGVVRWEKRLPPHAWSSPVVVDSVLMVADCLGAIHAYDVRRPEVNPPELWTFQLPSGACIESTPAVWDGRIYVGARDGYFYAIGDR